MPFPPRTWPALTYTALCRASGERGQSIRDRLPLLRVDPHRLCHVKSFSLPCMCLLGLLSYCLSGCTNILWFRRDHQSYAQWLIKGIFICKTNDQPLKGNESLSEQPLCPVLNYLVKLTCNLCTDWTNSKNRTISSSCFELIINQLSLFTFLLSLFVEQTLHWRYFARNCL